MIVAAAIRSPEGQVFGLPAPARHGDIIRWIVENEYAKTVPPSWRQGFIDDRLGFVGRIDAWVIAEASQQLLDRAPTDGRGGTLYSEDVW